MCLKHGDTPQLIAVSKNNDHLDLTHWYAILTQAHTAANQKHHRKFCRLFTPAPWDPHDIDPCYGYKFVFVTPCN